MSLHTPAALQSKTLRMPRSKAVAEGAVAYHLHHYVSARIAKICYGLEGVRTYDERNADHVMQKLKDKLREDKYGERVLAGAFISLLKKVSGC